MNNFSKILFATIVAFSATPLFGAEPVNPSVNQAYSRNDAPAFGNNPRERRFGLEFNFMRLATWGTLPWNAISGGFSFFDHAHRIEWAIPFTTGTMYTENEGPQLFGAPYYSWATVDFGLRKYVGKKLSGFFIGAFARTTYQEGYSGTIYDSGIRGEKPVGKQLKGFRSGLGMELGYRIFSNKGMYWGVSLGTGKYLIGKKHNFKSTWPMGETEDDIVDVSVLKFGYAF